jgi:hypothetical protein
VLEAFLSLLLQDDKTNVLQSAAQINKKFTFFIFLQAG